eukprot:TRINITY_DN32109_c0_g1_i1.p1 TRINITY_DN32109_c0_g1~~TRINITY_DN32109_c0_g1_i1.p1  ORF type:complete len:107 (-),score=16.56 TRINITY_DN32109_c0_g1_i1:105-425(-)
MAFFTCVKANVPIYGEDSEDDTGSESSTLQSADPIRQMVSSNFSTPTPTVPEEITHEHDDHTLKEGLSTETVNTITEDDGRRILLRTQLLLQTSSQRDLATRLILN